MGKLAQALLPRAAVCVLLLTPMLMAGCNAGATTMPADDAMTYGGTLSTAHAAALDVFDQLALGTLRLEETDDAVTEAQATTLLPLWQALNGGTLQVEAERLAIAAQIERAMTEAQVAAIAAMTLTQADQEAWAQEQGTGGFGGAAGPFAPEEPSPGEAGEAPAAPGDAAPGTMREQFEAMTEEERAQMREQMQARGQAATGGALPGRTGLAASSVMRAVVILLSQRSGQMMEVPGWERPVPGEGEPSPPIDVPAENAAPDDPASSNTAPAGAEPTATPVQETDTRATDDAAQTGTASAGSAAANAPQATATPAPAAVASTRPVILQAIANEVAVAPAAEYVEPAITTSALVQVEDTNPGPPFAVEISLNQATPNPLLDGTTIYRIGGLLRNVGDEVYAVNTVHVTFYDFGGFRGSYNPFPARRYGEYIWHGALEADFDCMLLAPGEACPFTAQITAHDMSSFLVHADAVVAQWREPAPVTVQASALDDQGGSVRIRATITNPNDYAIKNVVATAALLDANGAITSIGSAYHVQSIAPGGTVACVVNVPTQPYASYQLFAQAEGDFQ